MEYSETNKVKPNQMICNLKKELARRLNQLRHEAGLEDDAYMKRLCKICMKQHAKGEACK